MALMASCNFCHVATSKLLGSFGAAIGVHKRRRRMQITFKIFDDKLFWLIVALDQLSL
jgi:hypothetical protein